MTYQDYVSNPTPEARTVLTIGSFHVASDYFPGGAGFGRYGSAVAATNYSPEYVARGFTTVWGLGRTEEDGRFVTDTEWPAIIGETGFIGALAFAFGLVGVYRAGVRLWQRARVPLVRQGGSAFCEICLNRHNLNAPVTIEAEGLPLGVTEVRARWRAGRRAWSDREGSGYGDLRAGDR